MRNDSDSEETMREDIDLAYRCYHCNGLVFKSDILYPPHGCTKCGGSKVRPINGLTWFGVLYCKFWNWYKFKTKLSNSIGFDIS